MFCELYEGILQGHEKIAVIGLGYVGLPIAVAFARKVQVIGFDLNPRKIAIVQSGVDPTQEVGNDALQETTTEFTGQESKLKEARFHIIAVPTPIKQDKTPDLSPIVSASTIIGRNLVRGSVVVYESTVYPGVTEDVCISILEKESHLKCGVDFKVGYSPERINPGDRLHKFENIKKIVSGIDEESLDIIARVYELVISAGVYRAASIRVAEAAKVAENSQRDINIAFMNELAMVFDRMGIDTNEVIDAMNTKWNALGFRPGLVGGHCIGVDPYYFIYEAEKLGYHSQIILSGRKVNNGMGEFVADIAIKQMILSDITVRHARVVILGLTFKENCPDIRNSKVRDIIGRLREYDVEPIIVDPQADAEEVRSEYGLELVDLDSVHDAECVIFAVAHNEFKALSWEQIDQMYFPEMNGQKVLIDVKGIIDKREAKKRGIRYWRL